MSRGPNVVMRSERDQAIQTDRESSGPRPKKGGDGTLRKLYGTDR